MLGKIQRIGLIKFNPNHFHMDPFCFSNIFTIMGGAPTLTLTTVGALFSYSYYAGQVRAYNLYMNTFRVAGRIAFGATLGMAIGFKFFGDR